MESKFLTGRNIGKAALKAFMGLCLALGIFSGGGVFSGNSLYWRPGPRKSCGLMDWGLPNRKMASVPGVTFGDTRSLGIF